MRLGLKQLGAGGGILALLVAGLAGGALASRTGDAGAAPCGPGGALDVIGLTSDQRLVCFEANDPAGAATIGALTGLTGDTALVGMDFRPATGVLYGVGNAGGIYTLDTATAVATMVSQLSVADGLLVWSRLQSGAGPPAHREQYRAETSDTTSPWWRRRPPWTERSAILPPRPRQPALQEPPIRTTMPTRTPRRRCSTSTRTLTR